MDLPYLILVVVISVIGLIMMFSASYATASERFNSPTYFFTRQGPYLLLGWAVMLLVSRVNYQYFRALSIPLMSVAMVLMALVPFIGESRNNARRWINVFGISVQPSEIVKIGVIVLFSAMITAYGEKMSTFRHGVLPFFGILAAVAGLLVLQPHLSGAVLTVGVGAVLLFCGGTRLRYFAAGALVATLGGIFIVTTMPYAQQRIAIWRNPWLDPQGKGYQIIQSLLAVGSGGMFGLGLGKSRQKLLYLPEQHNDFVFAIVCEELGFVGTMAVLTLFLFLVLRGYWIAARARDRFGSLLAIGVTSHIALQTFLNVAVVTNLIPVTGISMPFFSYGGTALLMMLAETGIVLAVSRQIRLQTGETGV
jgi:cell division protein FtsW